MNVRPFERTTINRIFMGKIISISIFKGGTGKTATAVSLSASLSQMGHSVLLIDLDQQGSATRHLGLDPEQENPNLFHVFTKQVPPRLAIKELEHGFSILPGNALLAAVEESMEEGDEGLLKELLAGIFVEYDFIILDTTPGKAMLSLNALNKAFPKEREYLLVIAYTLARVNEINRMKWSDVHDDHLILRTRKSRNSDILEFPA